MAETIGAVVFDAYGTLFDVHSVVARCDQLFPARGKELSHLWRGKQLEYTWLRSLMGRYEDFESITRSALTYACRGLGLELSDDAAAVLMAEYRRLAPYPDVAETLGRLRGRRLAILSNGAPDMLDAVVRHAGLEPMLDAVLSVDPLQTYKPHPSVYQLAVDRLGTGKEAIAFVSSNFWDVCGATAFGFRTVWINRGRALPDQLGLNPAAVLSSLSELPAALA
jgi:2-haloacid dehalogenase